MTQLATPEQTPKQSRLQRLTELARKKAKTTEGEIETRSPSNKPELTASNSVELSEAEPESDTSDEPEIEIAPTKQSEPKWKRNALFLSQYLLRRDDPRAATHSSMMLGRYFIPPEMREEFYRKYYAEVLSAQTPSLFLTERYNEEDFRFFVDIDYEFDEHPVPKHTQTIAKIQQVFVDLWDPFNRLSIPTIDLFPCRAASRTDWKLHVIFYKTIVDWQSVLKFGGHVQSRLAGDHIKIDMKVYTKGSLRMLGSYKKFDTTPTHPNETESVYTPIDIHTGEPLEWTDQTLEEYSIFLTPAQKECLEETRREQTYVTTEFGIDFGTSPDRATRVSTEPTQYTGSGTVHTGSPLYQCIKDNFGEILASATGRIIHDSATNCSSVDCSKTTFCPLAGRYHSSNHPYIVLSEFGMKLKCHSTTDKVCCEGGKLIRRAALPEEVLSELPAVSESDDDEADEAGVKWIVRKNWSEGDTGMATIAHNFLKNDVSYSSTTKTLYYYNAASQLWVTRTQNEFKWVLTDAVERSLRPLIKDYVEKAAKMAAEEDQQKQKMLDQCASDALSTLRKYKSTKGLSYLYPQFEGLITTQNFESKFDQTPYLLGVKNGVIDLRTGELRERTRDDNLFRLCPID
jgi:hypothetical protein